jgi:hypothetical protein
MHDQWKVFRERLKTRVHSATMADLGRNLKGKRAGTPPPDA